jgi:hypothetical protein
VLDLIIPSTLLGRADKAIDQGGRLLRRMSPDVALLRHADEH